MRRDGRGFMRVRSGGGRTVGSGRENGRREHAVVAVVADVRLAQELLSLPSGIARVLGRPLGAAVLLPHGGVAAIKCQELLVGAPFHHGAGMEDDDLVGVGDGRQSMAGADG